MLNLTQSLLIILTALISFGRCSEYNCNIGGIGRNNIVMVDGYGDGMTLNIRGRPNNNRTEADGKWGLSLYRYDPNRPPNRYQDSIFVWEVRMDLNLIITEPYKNGFWVGVKNNHNNFPFTVGKDFTLEIDIEKHRFAIYVNGKFYDEYRSSLGSLESYNGLNLWGTDTQVYKSWCFKQTDLTLGSGNSVSANFHLWFSIVLLIINVKYKVIHMF
jgi:hypothetical protein